MFYSYDFYLTKISNVIIVANEPQTNHSTRVTNTYFFTANVLFDKHEHQSLQFQALVRIFQIERLKYFRYTISINGINQHYHHINFIL